VTPVQNNVKTRARKKPDIPANTELSCQIPTWHWRVMTKRYKKFSLALYFPSPCIEGAVPILL